MKSTKRLRLALVAAFLFACGGAEAVERLHGYEIRHAFPGITLDGVYRNGAFFSETYNEDGTIRYHDTNGADSGRWEAILDKFCTYYESQQGACFYVVRDGTNCFTFYQVIEGRSPRDIGSDDWTSRGWNRAQPATCPKAPEAEI
jgi:hypothetical protein